MWPMRRDGWDYDSKLDGLGAHDVSTMSMADRQNPRSMLMIMHLLVNKNAMPAIEDYRLPRRACSRSMASKRV